MPPTNGDGHLRPHHQQQHYAGIAQLWLLHLFPFTEFATFLIALATTATGFPESLSPRHQLRSDQIRHIRSACPIQHAEILQPPWFDAASCDDITLTIAAFPP